MGMFDNLYINKNFLPSIPIMELNGYEIKELQTKDFDNLLENYFVDENGSLVLEKVDYEIIVNEEPPQKGKWTPPFFQEEIGRSTVNFPFTGIVNGVGCYLDSLDTKDKIYLDLKFKFINGILQGVGVVDKIDVTPIKEVLECKQFWKEFHNKRKKDPIFQILRKASILIHRIIYRLQKLNNWINSYEPK
jgi:hypothetical protein